GKHVLVRSDNTVTVAYINHQGGVRSFSHVTTSPPSPAVEPTQSQISACHSHSGQSQSYGRFSVTTGFARRRVEAPPPVGPTDLGSIWPGTSRSLCLTGIHPLPVVVRSNRGSPQYRCTGTQLAEGPAQVCVSPSEPHCTDSVQSQGGQGTDSLGSPLLAQQNLFLGPGASGISSFLAHSSEEGPPLSGEGHNLAPAPRSLEPPPMVQEVFRDLSPSVVNPPLTGKSPLHQAGGLQQDPFEPLQSVELDALSLKTALLTALTSVKRVGDLQALSVNSSCLEFGLADSHVVLRPQPGYVPKVPTTAFRDQVVTLQAISSQEDDPNLTLLCSVHALRIYMERTQPFRRSEQLFVCYGGQQKGKAVSKQRISHWLVDTIRTAYQARGLPYPLGVRAHSTRGIAASAALANGASLTNICRAA
ncbi:hypothetical protein M9458_029895, partial [Cirrhinus mrigala]